jgi:hypothetical protein
VSKEERGAKEINKHFHEGKIEKPLFRVEQSRH